MNDLSDLEESVALFLFGKVHEEHWKTSEGSVIGILNASLTDKKDQGNSKVWSSPYRELSECQYKIFHPQYNLSTEFL